MIVMESAITDMTSVFGVHWARLQFAGTCISFYGLLHVATQDRHIPVVNVVHTWGCLLLGLIIASCSMLQKELEESLVPR